MQSVLSMYFRADSCVVSGVDNSFKSNLSIDLCDVQTINIYVHTNKEVCPNSVGPFKSPGYTFPVSLLKP